MACCEMCKESFSSLLHYCNWSFSSARWHHMKRPVSKYTVQTVSPQEGAVSVKTWTVQQCGTSPHYTPHSVVFGDEIYSRWTTSLMPLLLPLQLKLFESQFLDIIVVFIIVLLLLILLIFMCLFEFVNLLPCLWAVCYCLQKELGAN